MLLAGDVGGTKTHLGLFERARERPRAVVTREFVTLEYDSLGAMIDEFRRGIGRRLRLEAACVGVAGPVLDQVARLTNVPWCIDATDLAAQFEIPRVALLNDLTAMARAVPVLEPDELAVLQDGQAVPAGNAALIAAGTGLGEALLHNVDGRFVPSPSEGGHADFAPRTEREIELLRELIRIYGRASNEHVLSGPGLVNLYRFTHTGPCMNLEDESDTGLTPASITMSGASGRCTACAETIDLFVSVYGAEAGNLALRSLATAGMYIGGGIAPRILPALETGRFLEAFRMKEPMADLLAAIPVFVILNREAGLIGAAVHANTL